MIPTSLPPASFARRARLVALIVLAWQVAAAVRAAETTPAPTAAAEVANAATTVPKARRGIALSAKESLGLVKLGGTLTDRGDFAAAEIAFRQVLEGEAPEETTKSALLGLAHMHRKQGALTKAAAIYEKFLKEYPGDDRVPDALLELGRTLRDMGAPRMAISRFYNVINSTLKLPSGSGFEHYQLLAKTAQFEVAETHFESGEYAEANKFFSRLRMLDLAPVDRARAHFKSAYALQLSGDLEGAVTSLRSFLDQWPDDENAPEARYLLATTLRIVNRPQEALAATLDLLRAERSHSKADPKRWVYWQRRTGNQLANAFFEGGDILNALAIYHGLAALSDQPQWRVPVSYQIALCYERLGDVDRATKTFRNIVDSAGQNPPPEVADIARMATARLAHVEWRDVTDRQVASLFDTGTGQPSPSPTAQPANSNDANRSPATAPSAL
jgi:TolA-binding protein